ASSRCRIHGWRSSSTMRFRVVRCPNRFVTACGKRNRRVRLTPTSKEFESRRRSWEPCEQWFRVFKSAARLTGTKHRWRSCHERSHCGVVSDCLQHLWSKREKCAHETLSLEGKSASHVYSQIRYNSGCFPG